MLKTIKDKNCLHCFFLSTFGQNKSSMDFAKEDIFTFGEKLRFCREKRNMSLREVAVKIGMDSSLLGKIERNERSPTKEQIKLVAKFFKINELKLIRVHLSDQLAYKIIEANVDADILKVAEQKIEYIKSKKTI